MSSTIKNGAAVFVSRKMLICVFTGFTSGIPFFLLLNLLQAWLRTEGVSLKAIGLLALVQLPYTWKFLWAPLLDRFALSRLGRRRSWMLMTQVALFLAIGWLGNQSPTGMTFPDGTTRLSSLLSLLTHPVSLLSMAIAFLSATQDIAIDAFRREILMDEGELSAGNSLHVAAYRIAGLIPGSLSLILADHLPWKEVFWMTALFMLPGAFLTLCVGEPGLSQSRPRTLYDATIPPFLEFIRRQGVGNALVVLAFIFLYKLGDSLCTALATSFYLDMGFSKTDLALVAKHAGLWPSIAGGIAGGIWMTRIGINRALWLFGIVQVVSILGFAWLSCLGPYAQIGANERATLAAVIGVEALGVGLGTAAFLAFISRATNPVYTATQFALFSCLAASPRALINASAGVLVGWLGWFNFFILCTLLALPGMMLLPRVAPWRQNR